MIPYVVLISAIVVFGALEHSRVFAGNGRNLYIILITILLILYSGFRNVTVGADTENYNIIFESCKAVSWSTLFKEIPNWTVPQADDCEFGFVILTKLFQMLSTDYRIYLVTIAVLFFISLSLFIKNKSCDICFSYLVFVCMFFSFYGTTGIRQTVATCFAVFLGYRFAKKNQLLLFIFTILLSCTIHKSAFFFFPFYLLVKIKPSMKNFIITYIVTVIVYLLRFSFINLIAPTLGYEMYAAQSAQAGTPVFTFVLVALSFILMIRINNLAPQNSESVYWVNAILFALVLTPFTFIDPNIMRALQYYSIFLILAIPELIHGFEGREKMLAWTICAALLIFMFLRTDPVYSFMW